MNSNKVAQFIASLRKAKNMTQKDLAEKLGVTDKAVSKWERGLSYPDITLLSSLSELLGVSVSELLNGEKADTCAHTPEIESVVETTLQYANNAVKSKTKIIRKTIGMILSYVSLIGIIVCAICDIAVTGGFTWSLYPISSIIFAWSIMMPVISFERNGIIVSLTLLSILLIPYLFIISLIIGESGLLIPIGIRVSGISIVYLWAVYILFTKFYTKYTAAGISVLLAGPLSWLINYIIDSYVGHPGIDVWDIISLASIIIISAILFSLGYSQRKIAVKGAQN